jgi:hypothetical protein
MPRPIKNIEIYLPLNDNAGHPFPEARFVGVQRELLARYGGVTSTQRQFPLEGLWKFKRRVFQDWVMVFSVMDYRQEAQPPAVRYLEKLKDRLKKRFDQLDVLITLQELIAI